MQPTRNPACALVVTTAALALTVLSAPAVSAHTELLQGSPGPTQEAGGTVDFIDLVFVEPVSNVEIRLEDPNGEPVDGVMVVPDGQVIRYEMRPLTVAGRYIVRYTMRSSDGDDTDSAYFFVYRPDATQPIRLGDATAAVDPPSSGTATVGAVVAGFVVIGCLIGLLMIFLTRLERGRARAAGGKL